MSDVVIKAENLSKVYKIYEKDIDRLKEALNPFHKRYSKDFFALRDISFEIRRGENIGLIGKNGAGKSTLLKIITGVLTPSSGTLTVQGRIASLLELGAGFNPDMTGIENIYMTGTLMGHDQVAMNAKIDDIVAFADIGEFINQPVKTYSSGMFARVAFAVNAFVEPDILIIDEALSVGDAFFQSKCMDRMRRMIDSGVTVLFVSHDTFSVKNLCQRAFLLDAGKILMDASAREVVQEYRNMMIEARHENSIQKTDSTNAFLSEARKNQQNAAATGFDLPITNLEAGVENFNKNANYQRIQNGMASFENVQLLDLNGELISDVIFGQEVILRMVVKFHEDIECLGMGYHIRNLTGVDLVYTDSRFNDTKAIFDARRGETYVVDWKFRVELRQEIYNIACVISIPLNEALIDPETCDFVPCAIQMNVINPNPYLTLSGGYVHWQNDLKVTKIQGDIPKKIEAPTAEDKKIIATSILFDAAWYCTTYGFGRYFDAVEHYLRIGWREGKNPSPFFSSSDYLSKNPDVNINPLLHFEKIGFKAGIYREEINLSMPKILARHPECKSEFNGGLLRIRITNACNAKCRYCGVRLGFGEEVNHAMEPNWYYEICRPLYEKINIVLITGGDAFFAKESYNYMKFLSDNFPKITVMTESNGIAFNEKFQTLACQNLFKTHFSINASNADIFARSCWDTDDGTTARKMFEIMIRNIKNYIEKLDAAGRVCFAPDLSMVINKDNADDILDFTELALKIRAGFIVFFFDYTENDMTSDYFTNPEITRPALKTLMEIERVLAGKFSVYFRLWIPIKEAEIIQPEVEAIPIEELRTKYAKILKLAENRSVIGELNERNRIRREIGKAELDLVNDLAPTLHLKQENVCFAPWNEIDLYPDGRMDFCGWFDPTLNIKSFIHDNQVNWDNIINSFEYVSARYRILKGDFRGCQVCCPMNSVKSPIESVTKYNLERVNF